MISFQISIHFFQRVQTSTAWKPPDVHLAAKLDDLDGVVLVPMEEDDATIDDMKSGVPRFGVICLIPKNSEGSCEHKQQHVWYQALKELV